LLSSQSSHTALSANEQHLLWMNVVDYKMSSHACITLENLSA